MSGIKENMKDLFVNYGMILFAKLDRLFLFVFRTNKSGNGANTFEST